MMRWCVSEWECCAHEFIVRKPRNYTLALQYSIYYTLHKIQHIEKTQLSYNFQKWRWRREKKRSENLVFLFMFWGWIEGWRDGAAKRRKKRKKNVSFVHLIRFHFSSTTWCSLSFELPRLSFQLEQFFVFRFIFFTVPS